ncbi:hypothetical protein CK203_036096 [Vitis vinifera]|uniref:Reverse transcriptase domain-containing protein n=1 Tax=Vitis vinifera TaxID=29760 RepID=A0A438HR40_VITVI|nr:hypothetical protein CK203_036096 [Vitis vinifera]
MDFEALNRQDLVKLEEPFTEEEVFNTLLARNGDKAPGPDSFSMAFWLKKMINKMVSNFQNAFVEGRQILDTILIANEVIDSMLKSNRSGGDSLSLYLFVLAMETLSCLLRRAREAGFLTGFKVNERWRGFGGLKINLTKSELILVGRPENLEELAVRDFLWGGGTLNSKPHLVKWDMVCSNRRKRGLDVKRLHSLNKTLLWVGALRKREVALVLGYGRP